MACDGTIGLSSEFHGFNGSDRYVLTIITDAECPPETIGFRLLNEGEEPLMPQAHAIDIDVAAPVAPEDEDAIVGVEIDGEHDIAGGMEIHGQPVIAPDRDDHLSVTGVEIYRNTALATMREACQFYHVSTSGGKTRRAFAETSFFFWSAPVAFRRVALETPEWTSKDSNHHRQSVSARKTNAIPTEPSGRLAFAETSTW